METKRIQAGVRILIAGNNGLFREGLKTLLEEQRGFAVAGEAHDTDEIKRSTALSELDIILLEMETAGLSCLEDLKSIQKSNSNLKIILLVADMQRDCAKQAFDAGIRGIILKESATNSLFACINAVVDGKYWIPDRGKSSSPLLQDNDFQPARIKVPPAKFGLTKREMQILVLVVAGRTNREVAKRFSISEQTVKHHVTNIFDKVGVYNRLELALFAIHHGLTTGGQK